MPRKQQGEQSLQNRIWHFDSISCIVSVAELSLRTQRISPYHWNSSLHGGLVQGAQSHLFSI